MTSERRTTFLMITLIIVACGGYAYWWLQTHHLVDKEFRLDPSKEVRENPFRAAQLFLEQKGFEVELSNELGRFQSLPPSGDMIIGERLGGRLPEQRVNELLAWVANGGQLLTSVQRSWSKDKPGAGDRLLSLLGIDSWHPDPDSYSPDSYPLDNKGEDQPKASFAVASITLNSGETIEAEFKPDLSLYDDSDRNTFYLSTKYSNHLLIIPHGKGWVMLATDLTFIRNPGQRLTDNTFGESTVNPNTLSQPSLSQPSLSQPYINNRDHAFLLNWLAAGNNKVWLVREISAEPLTALLWKHAHHAVIALTCLLLFWLWWLYNRFGPLHSSTIAERRNILEHLLMSATYAWRQDRAQQLFADTRKELELLMRRKHPQMATLQQAERTIKLAEHCALSVTQIDRALHREWNGEREFIELTNLLQQIRKKL